MKILLAFVGGMGVIGAWQIVNRLEAETVSLLVGIGVGLLFLSIALLGFYVLILVAGGGGYANNGQGQTVQPGRVNGTDGAAPSPTIMIVVNQSSADYRGEWSTRPEKQVSEYQRMIDI